MIHFVLPTILWAFSPIASAAETPAFHAEVLDTLVWIEPRVDDLKIAELSGIAYDRKTSRLYAVSDRSRLFVLDFAVSDDVISTLHPLEGHRLTGPNGVAMRDLGFNPEGIARLENNTLMIVSEAGPRIARFSLTGEWLYDVTVPDALQDPSRQRSENDGLESLGWHPMLGLVKAPEEPLTTASRGLHTLYSSNGRSLSFDTAELGATSIKSLDVMADGRLLILERDRAEDDSLITYLRVLDPATCPEQGLCATHVARIDVPTITDADFEGLTQVADDLYLIVSDDKVGKDDRSVFVLLRVDMPPAH